MNTNSGFSPPCPSVPPKGAPLSWQGQPCTLTVLPPGLSVLQPYVVIQFTKLLIAFLLQTTTLVRCIGGFRLTGPGELVVVMTRDSLVRPCVTQGGDGSAPNPGASTLVGF